MKIRSCSSQSEVSRKELYRGRFAPSPTGYMHLGNVWVALASYCATKQKGGKWILRIEDIDRARCKPIFENAIYKDLEWLGLHWDEGPHVGGASGFYKQSERIDIYKKILSKWKADGLIYPCNCKRSRLQQISSAPHRGERKVVYDGRCRQKNISVEDGVVSWRWKQQPQLVRFFADNELREIRLHPCNDDIVLYRSDGVFSYQLAVSVDDALMDVSEVVRGNDLVESIPNQVALIQRIGGNPPSYRHVPMLIDETGNRLSKRQQAITIQEFREAGWKPEDVWGLFANYIGMTQKISSVSLLDILKYDITLWNLKRSSIIMKERAVVK